MKKKKLQWQKFTATAFFMLMGAVCGFLIAKYVGEISKSEKTLAQLLVQFAALFGGLFLQMIIHEAGHLFFGLLSGYSFSSFRIGSFMWIKENGKIRLKRLSIAGTGGQCLMAPPKKKDGKTPVVLYNLGGSFMNIIAGGVFLGLHFLFSNIPLLSAAMLILALVGLLLAIMNGLPMRLGAVDNDGYNAFALTRNEKAAEAFCLQLSVNEQLSKGVRIKEMPEEWFTLPSDEDMKNSMVVVMGVLRCNRLMDEKNFDEAEKLMAHILSIDSGLTGLHRSMMICDRIYVELLLENRPEVVQKMLTKEQKKLMQQMKKFPTVIRTNYALALLFEKDTVKAEKIKADFEKCAKTYPYESDIQSERELVELCQKRSAL